MVRAAVIGAGSMGQNHARIYASLDNVEFVAIADVDENQGNIIAKKYKTKYYKDYKEMFLKEDLDVVSIVVPSKLHHQVSLDAINANLHILLEKPISLDEGEAREIIAAAKKHNVKLMIGHIERFNPAIIELRKRLLKKEIGEIYKIDVQRIGPYPNRITDVGVIVDLAVHDVDIIEHLTGLQIKNMYAETQQRIHPRCEDSLSALIIYEGEVIANLNINYLSPKKIRKIFVFGEKGMFEVDYLTQDITLYKNANYTDNQEVGKFRGIAVGDCITLSIPKEEPLLAEIKSFVDCVVNDLPPPVTGEDGLRALVIANKLLEASKRNEPGVKLIHKKTKVYSFSEEQS